MNVDGCLIRIIPIDPARFKNDIKNSLKDLGKSLSIASMS